MSGGAVTVGRLVVSVSGDVDQLAIDMREAQAITGAATKDIVNGLQGITEATYARNDAGKRMIAALQEELNTFGMSSDELKIYKAGLLGVGDQAAALVDRLNSMKAAQAGFNDQIAATESAATARIKEMVAASMSEASAMNEVAAAAGGLTAAQMRLGSVAGNVADATRLQNQNMAATTAAMRAAAAGTGELSAQTQSILARYDPLGVKLRSLQSDMTVLRKEMGNSIDPAAMKAFQGLEEEIDKTRGLMAKAGVEGFGAMESGASKSGFATAGATRELMVLGHEVMTGNFSRIPGSLMVLTSRAGGLGAMIAELTGTFGMMAAGALVVLGPIALAAAAAYQGQQDFKAMNAAIGLTSNYASQTVDSMNELATRIGAAGQMTTGTAKEMVTSFVASGQIGGQALEKIALLAGNYAKATGQSVDEVTPKLIQLFNNPKQGADDLKNSMHLLTAENVDYISKLEDSGQHQQAQLVLAEALAGHLATQANQVSGLTAWWHELTGAMSAFWDVAKQHMSGTATPYQAGLQAAQAELDRLQSTPNLFGGDSDLDAKISKQKQYIASLIAGHQQEEAAAKAAADASSAETEKQNAIYTELHKGQLQRIQDLKNERAILDGAPDTSAVEARRAEIDTQILQIQRSIGAEGRQLTQQQLTDGEQYNLLVLQGQASRLQNQLNFGAITKEQFDQGMTQNALYQNAEKQDYERRMANVAGLTAAERLSHLDKLRMLQEEASQIADNGKAAVATDEKKVMDDYMTALDKSGEASLQSLDAQIGKEHQHGMEIGLTKAQVDALHSAQQQQAVDELQAQETAIENLLATMDVNDKSLDQARKIYTELMAQLDTRIDKERQLASISADNSVRDADAKAAADAAKAWKHAANTIENDLTSAIVDGGGNGWKKLVHDMEMAFAKLILHPILEPISGGLATVLSPFMSSNSIGGSGATGSSSASLVGDAQTASSVFKAISNGFSTLSTGVADAVQAGLYQTGLSTQIASNGAFASGVGTAAGMAGGYVIGSGLNSAISGQYSTGSGLMTTEKIATAVASYFGPEFGAIAGAISGLVNRAFGMGSTQVQSQGMSGTLTATSLTGDAYQNLHQDGGWFRSDKNWQSTTAFDAQTTAQFTQGLAAIEQASSSFAKSLGVSADWVSTYSKAFDITLTGDATKDAQAVTDFFNGVGDELANKLVPNLADFSKTGETASATLQRLAGDFTSTNQIAQLLGKSATDVFGSLGMDSAAARERLIDLAGGVSTLASQAQTYATNFLNSAQKLAPVTQAVDDAMASLGLSSVQTVGQFKSAIDDLVSSGAILTDAGSKEFASLMALNDAFLQAHGGKTADAILQERQGLQDQLDQLTMSSAQLLAKQRDALDDSNKALFDQVQALTAQAAAVQAAKDTATSLLGDVDSMFTVLQNTTKKTTDAISARITAEQALKDAVTSTLGSMTTTSADLSSRAAAQAQIQAALAIAKAGGPLPTADSLKNALSVVSQDASTKFASQADYLKDLYSTKNDLSQLGDLADSSLSVDQQQLDSLNAMLAADQQQIDLLKGIATSLTVQQAQAGFQSAVSVAQANPTIAANSGISSLYQSILGRAPDAAGLTYWQNAAASGMSLDQIASFMKSGDEYKHLQGVPGFAAGGDFAGGLRIVGESGPELEATGPARIFNANQTSSLLSRISSSSGNNDALLAEIKALRETAAKQQAALDRIAQSTKRHADMYEQGTAGGGPLLVEIAQ